MKPLVAAGIDVGGTSIKAALVNRRGRILVHYREPTEAHRGRGRVGANILSIIRRLESHPFSRGGMAGIGLAVAGLIDVRQGVIVTSPNFPGWKNFPIRQAFAREFKVPLFIENDANAAALGERWLGAGRDALNFCFLTLGTGVGGGLILGGDIWRGSDGMAGEVGHMTIDPKGPVCDCGSQGCLEVYASIKALNRMILELRSQGLVSSLLPPSTEELIEGISIYRAAGKGDPIAKRAFSQMGSALGIGISSLINLLNLEKIVLGGGLSAAWRYFLPSLRREVKARAFRILAQRARIIRAEMGEEAGVLGAAYLVWKGLGFRLPAPGA